MRLPAAAGAAGRRRRLTCTVGASLAARAQQDSRDPTLAQDNVRCGVGLLERFGSEYGRFMSR
jgi:hypothetical protein